ncbi:MAG: hypothetical protein KDD62_01705 [Bdellovibrionales bacterium]|nr:hypothetical protein [Bdellovibrionales bacterium]
MLQEVSSVVREVLQETISGEHVAVFDTESIEQDPLSKPHYGMVTYRHEATPADNQYLYEIRLSPFAIGETIHFKELRETLRELLGGTYNLDRPSMGNTEFLENKILCVHNYHILVENTEELTNLHSAQLEDSDFDFEDLEFQYASRKQGQGAHVYGEYAERVVPILESLEYYAKTYGIVLINNQEKPVETLMNDAIAAIITSEPLSERLLIDTMTKLAAKLRLAAPQEVIDIDEPGFEQRESSSSKSPSWKNQNSRGTDSKESRRQARTRELARHRAGGEQAEPEAPLRSAPQLVMTKDQYLKLEAELKASGKIS